MEYHIFSGRFQPFHKGHLEILKQAVNNLNENTTLVIGVIAPGYGDFVDEDFGSILSEHLQPERNPWPVTVPLLAVTTLAAELRSKGVNNVAVTLLPSPDKAINQLQKWIPNDRFWIIPSAGEDFDEDKAAFYMRHGEKVIRYSESTGINGWPLRNAYFAKNYEFFAEGLPASIVDIYWNHSQ